MLVATAPFAREIQALKSELQATLSRISAPQTHRRERPPASPWSNAPTVTNTSPRAPSAATTPTTVRSDATTERASPSSEADATSRILRELVATARRRRQAETQLVRELERDARVQNDPSTSQRQAKHEREHRSEDDARENAIRREIDALRLRRKQIQRQIDDESKEEDRPNRLEEPTAVGGEGSSVAAALRQSNNQEYSIEGVVKLARVVASQCAREPTHRATPPNASSQPSQYPSVYTRHPELLGLAAHQRHQEVIQDVFSIQLKFAETMLQLEKSIQMRDRLLVQPSSTSTYRRRPLSSRRQAPLRRRSRQPATVYEDRERDPGDDSHSDVDEFGRRVGQSSDEPSMSETTSRLWRRYRLDRQLTTTGTTQSTPSTGASTAPESQPSPPGDHDMVATPIASNGHPRMSEQLHTPSTNDSTKQVRFNDGGGVDEYPTPLIARNISFDQDSIDSTTDDERPMMRRTMQAAYKSSYGPVHVKPTLSVLSSDDEAPSFMDGSSVCSADLNDESFLTAFTALRQELRGRTTEDKRAVSQPQLPHITVGSPCDDLSNTIPEEQEEEKAEEDPAKLKQRKRALTLNIQELTAKLVLAQDAATRDQVTLSLDRLRRQLRVIESHETTQV